MGLGERTASMMLIILLFTAFLILEDI